MIQKIKDFYKKGLVYFFIKLLNQQCQTKLVVSETTQTRLAAFYTRDYLKLSRAFKALCILTAPLIETPQQQTQLLDTLINLCEQYTATAMMQLSSILKQSPSIEATQCMAFIKFMTQVDNPDTQKQILSIFHRMRYLQEKQSNQTISEEAEILTLLLQTQGTAKRLQCIHEILEHPFFEQSREQVFKFNALFRYDEPQLQKILSILKTAPSELHHGEAYPQALSIYFQENTLSNHEYLQATATIKGIPRDALEESSSIKEETALFSPLNHTNQTTDNQQTISSQAQNEKEAI